MLEDLDSADDIALLSSTIMKHLQFKTPNQEDNSAQVGLKLNAKECKVLKVNSKSEASLNVGNCDVEVVDNGTKDGGGTSDSRKRIAMANASFRRLENIKKGTNIIRKIIVSLFQSLVLSVLLYGSETWKDVQEMAETSTIRGGIVRRRWNGLVLRKIQQMTVPWL